MLLPRMLMTLPVRVPLRASWPRSRPLTAARSEVLGRSRATSNVLGSNPVSAASSSASSSASHCRLSGSSLGAVPGPARAWSRASSMADSCGDGPLAFWEGARGSRFGGRVIGRVGHEILSVGRIEFGCCASTRCRAAALRPEEEREPMGPRQCLGPSGLRHDTTSLASRPGAAKPDLRREQGRFVHREPSRSPQDVGTALRAPPGSGYWLCPAASGRLTARR